MPSVHAPRRGGVEGEQVVGVIALGDRKDGEQPGLDVGGEPVQSEPGENRTEQRLVVIPAVLVGSLPDELGQFAWWHVLQRAWTQVPHAGLRLPGQPVGGDCLFRNRGGERQRPTRIWAG